MCNFLLLTIIAAIFLIVIIALALRKHYRKVIRAKEHDIVHHIRIQDQLAKELEYTNVEKQVMEKMLKTKFDVVIMGNRRGEPTCSPE